MAHESFRTYEYVKKHLNNYKLFWTKSLMRVPNSFKLGIAYLVTTKFVSRCVSLSLKSVFLRVSWEYDIFIEN